MLKQIPNPCLEYINALEEYIKFLEYHGKQDAVFCAMHGKKDSPKIIQKGKRLREKIVKAKAKVIEDV